MTTEQATITMRAFAVEEFGTPGSVRAASVPQVAEGEILVRVHAAGVNPFDLFIISGFAKDMMEHRFPLIPGVDAAGVVEQVGAGVTQFAPGDEVFGLFFKMVQGEGTYADYVVVPAAGLVARKPASLDFAQAAALPTAGLAAFQSVKAVAPAEGETILIVGAAGGVGSYAVQLAARQGARVIATGRSGQEDYLHSLGAAEVIDFASNDVVQAVRASHPQGIDGLIDLVSRDAAALAGNAQVLRRGGRLATPMNAADAESFAQQGIQATNIQAGMMSTPQDLEELARMVTDGELKVTIAHVFSLEETPQAFERLQAGRVQGKIVLDCRRS
jgi:NADPH:quinone reductase-like Zn-dependent oxidoreductase